MRTSHQEVFLFVATLAAALPTRGVPEPQPLRMGEYHSGQVSTEPTDVGGGGSSRCAGAQPGWPQGLRTCDNPSWDEFFTIPSMS